MDILPRANVLSISGGCYARDFLTFSKFKRVSQRHPFVCVLLSLSTLRFHSVQESNRGGASTSIPDPEFIARPKQLKEFALGELPIEVVEAVVKLVQNSMPCLDLIEFCCNCYTDQDEDEDEKKGDDDEIKSILTAGVKACKVVRFGADVGVGSQIHDDLRQHTSTLKELS
ncbi:hypothetical protein BGZ52_010230, partial [Haplosporangium bisporale]